MNRRGFLSKFWAAPLLPMLLVKEWLTAIDHPNYQYEFKGYRIRWTGWKRAYNQADEVAQWLAVSVDGEPKKRIYSSTPGRVGFYFPGYIFDISRRLSDDASGPYQRGAAFSFDYPQAIITRESTDDQRNEEQAKALRCLCSFIDSYGDKDPNAAV